MKVRRVLFFALISIFASGLPLRAQEPAKLILPDLRIHLDTFSKYPTENNLPLPQSPVSARNKGKAYRPPTKAERVLYWTAMGSDAGSCIFDMKSTVYVIDHGGYEADKLLVAFGNRNKMGILVSGTIGQTAFSFVIHRFLYERGHPKLAAIAHIASGATHVYFGIHNYRLYNR